MSKKTFIRIKRASVYALFLL